MTGSVWRVLNAFDAAGIRYCVLRDGEVVDVQIAPGETDLLIASEDFRKAAVMLAEGGFRRVVRWGYAPHHFFVGYDQEARGTVKLDVVTDIRYGRPVANLFTELAANCLNRRQKLNRVYVPSPEDELVTLLLHCILDKGRFAPERWSRLKTLRREVRDVAYVEALVRRYWPAGVTWDDVARRLDEDDGEALLAMQPALTRHLRQQSGWRSTAIARSNRALRWLNRLADRLQLTGNQSVMQVARRG